MERRGLQRKAFTSVKELREHLRRFIVTHNRESAKPFVWTKDAEQVIASVARAKQFASEQEERKIIVRN